jgi:hypothetical protein
MSEKNEHAVEMGRLGGAARSPAKTAAARRNARGRPKGSKNKPKPGPVLPPETVADVVQVRANALQALNTATRDKLSKLINRIGELTERQ